jgi:hypothetical protein
MTLVHRPKCFVRGLEGLDALEHVAQQQPRGQKNIGIVVDNDRA